MGATNSVDIGATIASTLAKYSSLTLLSFFVPEYVFGFVFAQRSPWDALSSLVFSLSALAIVIHFSREKAAAGVASALGIATGLGLNLAGFLQGFRDLLLQYLMYFLGAMLTSLWSLFARAFMLGFAIGLGATMLAVADFFVSLMLGLVLSVVVRAVNLVADAVEHPLTALLRNVENPGLKAVLAPAMAAIFGGAVYATTISLLITALALLAGYAVGVALATALVPFLGLAGLAGTTIGFWAASRLVTYSIPNRDVILDALVMLGLPWLAPYLWWAGYAMLTSRRGTSRALYLIALSLI